MQSSEHESFAQLSKLTSHEFARELFNLPIDLACDYIDLLYQKISNPEEENYKYYVEVVRDLVVDALNPYPRARIGDPLEIEAYVRAFPLFDFESYDKLIGRSFSDF